MVEYALSKEQIDMAYEQWCNGTKQEDLAQSLYVSERTLRRAFKRKKEEKLMECERVRAEAIKEFAERLNGILKKKRKNEQSVLAKTRYGECILAVDNLVYEMVLKGEAE